MDNVGVVVETLENVENGIRVLIYRTSDGFRVEGVDADAGATFGIWKFKGGASYYSALHVAASCVW